MRVKLLKGNVGPDPDFDENTKLVMHYYYRTRVAKQFGRNEVNLRVAVDGLLSELWNDDVTIYL